jgi:hypothetical protein
MYKEGGGGATLLDPTIEHMPELTKQNTNPELTKPEGSQSANWDKYENSQGEIVPDKTGDGFFHEGFPPGKAKDNKDVVYELIIIDGKRLYARVDYSNQYNTEGLQWISNGKPIDEYIVAAWKKRE